MIFKIAHICYCGDAVEAKKLLGILGYRLLFSERVRPMGITQRHLSCHIEEFVLSLWTRRGGISIELLEFKEYSQNEGLIYPLLPEKISGVVPVVDEEETFQLNNSKYIPAAFLGSLAYMKMNSKIDEPILDSFLLFTPDVSQSVHFWNTVGLDCIEHSNMHGILRLRCIFTRKDFFIHIYKSTQMETLHEDVNSLGFHVLGLISNSASQEHARIVSSRVKVTPIEQITIDEKRLTIFYVRSPEGLLVEIISLN